jgi:hypothetical protein
MYPIFIVELLTGDASAHHRRRDEEWRAWHRMPDAAPSEDDPPPEPRAAPGIGVRLASIAAHLPLANLIRREG